MGGFHPGRRTALAGVMALGAAGRAGAQPAPAIGSGAWPNRPVTIVVPWPAGGSTDTLVRVMAPRLAAELGQPVLVENRGGASGTVGHQTVARARPDGYTLLVGTNSTFAMSPHIMDIPYDHERSFAPLGMIAFNPLILAVHPTVPARSLPELIALARAQPGKVTYASAGAGSSFHLAMEMLLIQAKIDMLHVPYRGGGPATLALVAGEVNVCTPDLSTGLPFLRSEHIRGLATTGDKRSAQVPSLPTVAEAAGLAEFRCTTDFAMFAPTGTPEEAMRRIHLANLATLRTPEVRDKITELGIEVLEGTPAGFAAYYRAELEKWGAIVREKGIKAG